MRITNCHTHTFTDAHIPALTTGAGFGGGEAWSDWYSTRYEQKPCAKAAIRIT